MIGNDRYYDIRPNKIKLVRHIKAAAFPTIFQTARYVSSMDLFKGLNKLRDAFIRSDPDFSWGNNNHSLVDGEAILDHLADSGLTNASKAQVPVLRKRIRKLPEDVYVDLES